MTEELLPPDRTLASAAFDNEVTADERAQFETSPTLQAERDVYASVRAQLRDVDVPATIRDNAIAAALVAFDSLGAVGNPQTPARVVPLAPRRERRDRMRGWLAGVAAAAVIGVIGLAVVNRGNQDDDKSASLDTRAASIASTAAATESAEDSAGKSPALNSSAGGAADTTIVALDAPAAAPLDGRPVFESPEQIADVYGTGDAAADTTAAAVADSAAPAATTEAATQIAVCAADPALGDIAAIYRGEPVILRFRMDDELRVVDVIPEATCVVAETIPLG